MEKNENESVAVSVIQGNIDQSVKWDPAFMESTMNRYIALTRSTLNDRPGIIVWPESAAPFFFQDNTSSTKDMYNLAKESGAWMIFGCPAYEQHELKMTYFNRVCVISPDGSLSGYYDKIHLVPFGEYVPLRRLIPFVNRLVISEGEFSSGRGSGLLKVSDFNAGALVCYEAIFPDLAGREAKNGAGLFVNLTNDAWFGPTSAPYQHLSMCVFRSVENRRPFIRAANTGFSAFIDPYGMIIQKSDLFTEEVLKGEVLTGYSGMTFYSKCGDIFVYSILIICLIKFSHELCYHLVKKRRHKSTGNFKHPRRQ
jgi:apolipoprotein N-acyltransferase